MAPKSKEVTAQTQLAQTVYTRAGGTKAAGDLARRGTMQGCCHLCHPACHLTAASCGWSAGNAAGLVVKGVPS